MAASSPRGAGDQGVVNWANLKKLTAFQESQQPNLMQPEQLTPAQLRAFTELNRATSVALEMLSNIVAPEEPNLGGKDWVSLLQRYRNAHADGSHIIYTDESRGLKWCTFTKLSEAGDLVFPRDGFPFSKKKDAKQYAASKAVEWLMANQLMPNDGVNVDFKKQKECPPTPSSAKAAVVAVTPPKPGPASPPSAGAKVLPQTPKPRGSKDRGSSSGDKSPDESDDDNVVAQVEKVCRSFGYGTPRYMITPAENSQNMFNGRVNWGDEWRVPESVGAVNSIYGRKPARDLMAQEVLDYFREVVRRERETEKEEAMMMLSSQQSTVPTPHPGSISWGRGPGWPMGSIR